MHLHLSNHYIKITPKIAPKNPDINDILIK